MARPTLRTPELEIAIVTRLGDGETLKKICADESMPDRSSVYSWMRESPEFLAIFRQAKEDAAHSVWDEALEVSRGLPIIVDHEGEKVTVRVDMALVARNKLLVNTLTLCAEKLLPRTYGPKIAIGGADDLPPLVADPDPISKYDQARRIAYMLRCAAQPEPQRPLALAYTPSPGAPRKVSTPVEQTRSP